MTNLTVPATLVHDGTLDYIDYKNGIVHFSSAPTSVTATYNASVVNVIDGYPDLEKFEDMSLPLVAVDLDSKTRVPLQIGGAHFMRYRFIINIFENNDGAMDDLESVIEEGMQVGMRIYDYNNGFPLEPVVKGGEVVDHAVLAEFSYHIAKLAVQNGTNARDVYENDSLRQSAEQSALLVVEQYEGGRPHTSSRLTEVEQEEGLSLAQNYERFFEQRGCGEGIEFDPIIPGAGFLQTCKGDISIGPALFEVKTVNRNLAGKDIRQLIVYLALQATAGNRRWTRAGFLNPRKAEYHEFDVNTVITQISGGRSVPEVYRDLVDFACSRDVQIDTAF